VAAFRGVFAGLATLDLVYRVARPPRPNEKVTALRQDLAAGGPAANAAVTFARLGGDPLLITALGTHTLSRFIADELASHGVAILDLTPDAHSNPAASSIIVSDADGERSVVSVNAENATVTPPTDLRRLIDGTGVLLVDGHHPALAVAAAEAARAARVPVILDGGSWKPVLDTLLPLVDVAVCSTDLRVPGQGLPGPALLARGPGAVAVTHGPGRIEWWSGYGSGLLEVPQIQARDTLGAGDVFHGAFSAAIASRHNLTEALRFAAEVAAVRCTVPGPRAWLAEPALDVLAGTLWRAER
jgi:sugar/nucleoside kinase (ribokinase family)